jgi:hypothetical protein
LSIEIVKNSIAARRLTVPGQMLASLAPKGKRPERWNRLEPLCVTRSVQAPGRFIWQLVGVLDT